MARRHTEIDPVPVAEGTRVSPWTLALVVVGLLLAAGMRVWILSGPLGAVDMDEAVVGLMSRHFADGHLSVFFWGQPYGGSQEAMATAVVFALLGPSRVALKVVPMLGAAGTAWLVWRIGRRTVGEPQARIAAVLFLLGPAFFVLRSTRAYGFYATGIVVCAATLLAVLRLRERESTLELAGLGFIVGIGWWATPQVAFVIVPALVWLAVRAPTLVRRAHLVGLGALAGSAPWLLWSATHNWASLSSNVSQPGNTYSSHLRHFLSPLLPGALGLRVPYAAEWLPNAAVGVAAYAGLLVGFAYLVWKRARRLELMVVVALAYPVLLAVSPTSYYTDEPRYLYLLSPVLALLLASALATPLRQGVGIALVASLSIVALDRISVSDPLTPRTQLDPLIAALDAQQVDRVFAPYRIAYRLTFDSEERIVATPFDFVRSRSLDSDVRRTTLPGYVVLDGTPDQSRLAGFLAESGNLRDHVQVGPFHVYVPEAKLLPEQWRS
jgi:4-amino-4-deoxy-L-arabinose transferase-like glycosyltransferase